MADNNLTMPRSLFRSPHAPQANTWPLEHEQVVLSGLPLEHEQETGYFVILSGPATTLASRNLFSG